MTHASEPALTVGCPVCAPFVLDAGDMKLRIRTRVPTDSERLVHRLNFTLAKGRANRHFLRCIAKVRAIRRAKSAHEESTPANNVGPERVAFLRQSVAHNTAHCAAMHDLHEAYCKRVELVEAGACAETCEACVSA